MPQTASGASVDAGGSRNKRRTSTPTPGSLILRWVIEGKQVRFDLCRVIGFAEQGLEEKCWELYRIELDQLRVKGTSELEVAGVFVIESQDSGEIVAKSWSESADSITEASTIKLLVGRDGSQELAIVGKHGSAGTRVEWARIERRHVDSYDPAMSRTRLAQWRGSMLAKDVGAHPVSAPTKGLKDPLASEMAIECWTSKPGPSERLTCRDDSGTFDPLSLDWLDSLSEGPLRQAIYSSGLTESIERLGPLWTAIGAGRRAIAIHASGAGTIVLTGSRADAEAHLHRPNRPAALLPGSTGHWLHRMSIKPRDSVPQGLLLNALVDEIIARPTLAILHIGNKHICAWDGSSDFLDATCFDQTRARWHPLADVRVRRSSELQRALDAIARSQETPELALIQLLVKNLDEQLFAVAVWGDAARERTALAVARRDRALNWSDQCEAKAVLIGGDWIQEGRLLVEPISSKDCKSTLAQSALVVASTSGKDLPQWPRGIRLLAIGPKRVGAIYDSHRGQTIWIAAVERPVIVQAPVAAALKGLHAALFAVRPATVDHLLRGATYERWDTLGWKANPLGLVRDAELK